MRSGWQSTSLGEVLATLKNGLNCKQDKSGRGQKISRIESISAATFDLSRVGYAEISDQERTKFKLIKGDILFSHINSPVHVGKTAVFDTDEEVYHGVNLLLMRPTSAVSGEFLELYLKYLFAQGYWLSVCKQSVNQASVNQQDISRVPIAFPIDHEEQRRIVAILDEAFEGIATAKASAEKNLKNAGVLGELLRNDLFSRFAESTKRRRLGDVCTFVRGPFGGSLKKDCFVEDGYAVYEQSHAIYDQFSEVRYFVSEAKFDEMRRFELRPNDLIMSCSGTMGRVAIAPPDLRRGIINQALLKLTPSASVEAVYLKYWMESRDFQYALAQYAGGAAIQNVASVSVLKEIELPLPELVDQQVAIDQLDRFTTETERLHAIYEQKLLAFKELKKSLLHQAFTGQL